MEWNLEEGGEARHHACMWATTGNVVFCFILLSPTPSAWYSRSCVLFCTLIPCPAARSDLEAATFLADTCIKAGIKAGRYCKSHGLCVCLCVWFMTVSRISTPGRQTHFQQTPGYLRVTALLQDRYPNVTQPSGEAICTELLGRGIAISEKAGYLGIRESMEVEGGGLESFGTCYILVVGCLRKGHGLWAMYRYTHSSSCSRSVKHSLHLTAGKPLHRSGPHKFSKGLP